MSGLRIGVVGLGFGRSFVPIYQRHPAVESVAICEVNAGLLSEVGDQFGVEQRFGSFEDLLGADLDAVHILTPVPFHVEQCVAVLDSGKHCACAVPMATDLEGLRRVIDAQRRSGKNYMMMETAVYSKEFLFAKGMQERGEFGRITFLRGSHIQDLEGSYPFYWRSQPPMHYITHAISPLLAIAETRASWVSCLGAGRLRPDIQQPGANPFPAEVAIFQLAGSEAKAEVTRSWFQVARSFTESFSIYGERRSFEYPQLEHEDPVIFTLEEQFPKDRRDAKAERVKVPLRPDLFPAELAEFVGGWHGGSHPHLAHEFVSSMAEGRKSYVNEITAANWTAPGICAHESSMKGGEPVEVPSFGASAEC